MTVSRADKSEYIREGVVCQQEISKNLKFFSWPFVPLVFGLVCPGNNVVKIGRIGQAVEACTAATHQRAAYMKNYFLGAMPYADGYSYDV